MLYQGWMQKLSSVYSEAVLQLDGSHLELVYALLNELSDHSDSVHYVLPLAQHEFGMYPCDAIAVFFRI